MATWPTHKRKSQAAKEYKKSAKKLNRRIRRYDAAHGTNWLRM